MRYVQGFVAAVPAANEQHYRKHAAEAAWLFKGLGATRIVEGWGDDVPDGKDTDLRRAVNATADEVIVFSWLEFSSKQAHDAANARMMTDPRMQAMGATMPFDGRRMIFGGFAPIVDETTRSGGTMGYADCSLVPVPAASRSAYRELAVKQAAILAEYGAARVVEAWGDAVPDGKVTDYKRAVKAKSDETVVLAWVEWPSKAVRDAAWPKILADRRMTSAQAVFDGQRRVFGGFKPVVDV